MIRAARRPLVIAGLGCRAADAKWLRAFAEALPAPVLTTYKAKGAIPDPHPLALGIFTGGALEEPLVKRADLIIAFGLDTVELIPRRWAYSAPVLSLTRCAAADARLRAPGGDAYFTPALEVVGEPGAILEDLASRIMGPGARGGLGRGGGGPDPAGAPGRPRGPGAGLAPHRVAQMTRELTAAGSIATVDAGAHMFQATTYWQALEPGELLISNGLATMGFALPAAIAAQLVHPDRRVICFTGDGGLMMVASELETVARLRLPLLIVVFNDEALSLIEVKQEQKGLRGRLDALRGARSSRAGPRLRPARVHRDRRGHAQHRPDRGADRARPRADRRARRSLRLSPDARNRPRGPEVKPVYFEPWHSSRRGTRRR